MTRRRANIYIDFVADQWLRYLSHEEGRSYNDLVHEALQEYLERRGHSIADPPRVAPPSNAISHEEWRYDFEIALAQLRAGIPDDLTSDEIEQLITEAVEEVRQERLNERASVATND